MIQALKTAYRGYEFLSRTEARWARFFIELCLDFVYEENGWPLPSRWYLPDFYLPSLDCWIEIKGKTPLDVEQKKAYELCQATHKSVYVFSGAPWYSVATYVCEWDGREGCVVVDGLACTWGIYNEAPVLLYLNNASDLIASRHRQLVTAYAAARAERFEQYRRVV